MTEKNRCPECGSRLPVDAPEGQCLRCLMQVAMGQDDASVTCDGPNIEGAGVMVGRYKLLELIGEGGMGLVYLAEQQEPVRRQVALKIIKPGMDSKQVIARLGAERQVLALLDHPNIARVFDAGTTETGRPYFVMEYVKGMSITKYCDRHKLSIEQRLKLFLQVCYGVQHAHQKGIIHRDIKPSNILISVQDDRGLPKIIDFGIAKAVTQPLTEQTLFTRQGQLLGTPEYMSPEQADMGNEDIDTRADLYSLGVVLYELLTGVLPFEHEVLERVGFAELQRILQEEEPPYPSIRLTNLGEEAKKIAERRHTQVVALARRLHRELEWIPLKAMRKDRSRRYRSASEVADDIQNYLSGAPLIAGPETAIYHVKKFVRKHAGSVATVLLVAVALILGFVVSTMMYFRAEQAREQEAVARTRAERAEKVAQERAEDYRRALYVNRIALAYSRYLEGNIWHVHQLLTSCPDDLRGWEWYHLARISDQALLTLSAHKHQTKSVAFSPDGKRIISGGLDQTIRVWDVASGAKLMTLSGHEGIVQSVAFSPDGKRIASGGSGATEAHNIIKVWDTRSGAEVRTLRGHVSYISSVAFSPDGKRIASASYDKTVKVWDDATGVEVMTLRGHEQAVLGVAFSPDGQRIISGSLDKTIKVWDLATGSEVMTLLGHESYVDSVAFSSDGKRIVSSSWDGTAKVWDAATGEELMTLRGEHGIVKSAVFSPDGKRIICGSGRAIELWDASTGAQLMTRWGHESLVSKVVFSPDGKRIVSGSWDGTVKIWDTDVSINAESVALRGHKSGVTSVLPFPDGRRVVSGSEDQTIKIWDAHTGTEVTTLRGHDRAVWAVALSPDGKRIASAAYDKTIKLWDVKTASEVMTLRGHEAEVKCVAFSPNSARIISGSWDKTVKVWDASSGDELMTLRGHEGDVYCVAVSPDGNRMISGGDKDGTIRVWDSATGAKLMTLRHGYGVFSAAFSPDGRRIISGGSDGDRSIKIWNANSGAEIMTLYGHESGVYSVAFSPDGKRILSGSKDNRIKVWDAETGTELMTLRGHEDGVSSVSFSLDGKRIISGSWDGTIKFWDSTSRQEVAGKEKTKTKGN
ncbi:MAG: protein kinase domain-containing protein [Planctomycetota bacterium]